MAKNISIEEKIRNYITGERYIFIFSSCIIYYTHPKRIRVNFNNELPKLRMN